MRVRNARKLAEERTAGSDPGIRSSSGGPISLGPCSMTQKNFLLIICLDNKKCENICIITALGGGEGGGVGAGGMGGGREGYMYD
jgi:hypothetical protein